MAKSEIVEVLKKYIFILRSEGITVDKAYLYGSYLTNTATEESDIDVLIVTENENDNLTGKVWRLLKLLLPFSLKDAAILCRDDTF